MTMLNNRDLPTMTKPACHPGLLAPLIAAGVLVALFASCTY